MDSRDRTSMRAALFDAVQKQIDGGRPAQTGKTYERLILSGHTREQAMRLIASVLLAEMNAAMQSKKPFNEARYVNALKALPKRA